MASSSFRIAAVRRFWMAALGLGDASGDGCESWLAIADWLSAGSVVFWAKHAGMLAQETREQSNLIFG
jgi:hypothetical protein